MELKTGDKVLIKDFSCSLAFRGMNFLGQIVSRSDLVVRDAQEVKPFTFAELRNANLQRLPQFKNRKGEPAHSKPDGSDWSLAQWCNAVVGEIGEAANIIKKVDRGDMTLDEARASLADELADVQTYLDLLAFRVGINLGEATRSKWNRVSERVGCSFRV